tara:strand:- start:2213 stop:2440 length:228 start_codon:yes stop_codon:yes gene_type:complete
MLHRSIRVVPDDRRSFFSVPFSVVVVYPLTLRPVESVVDDCGTVFSMEFSVVVVEFHHQKCTEIVYEISGPVCSV